MIETERLVLRMPRLEDADAFVPFFADPEVTRFIGGVERAEAAPTIVARWLLYWERSGIGKFVVERRGDGCVVGRIGINVWDVRTWDQRPLARGDEAARLEVAWGLLRAHWGRGYAVEAAAAARDWFRAEHPGEELISLVNPANVASRRVAEKLGATARETVTLFDGSPAVVWVHPR